jgi:hypothetical protein
VGELKAVGKLGALGQNACHRTANGAKTEQRDAKRFGFHPWMSKATMMV